MEKFITENYLKEYDKLKCPPIQYVEELPSDNVENGIYAIFHEDTETKTITSRFTDILSSYFTEESKGKWTINESYSVEVDGNSFKSVALVENKYFIYANADYTEMYADSYLPQNDYSFTISEDISHTDFFAGNAENDSYVKLANVDEVERYFVRVEEKGRPNGVASLDVNGRVPVEQMPVQAFVYLGQWDASTGTYPEDGTTPGDFYEISVAGFIEGVEYLVGDWLVWSSDGWHKSENKNYVTEVNKKRGIVEVYGDNTEIETPTETSDKRTIKEYIDDITVDGNTWDEDTQNIESKAVVDVTELPETVSDKMYIKSKTDEEGNITKAVYAKDVKLTTDEENKSNIKSVNDETPDEDGAVVVDGDNINVTYKEEEMTLNDALANAGTVKTVDGIEPDEDLNIDSTAVEDVEEELPETIKKKVYNVTVTDEEGNTSTLVFSKNVELTTKDVFDALNEEVVKSVNTIKPDEDNNVNVVVEMTRAEYEALVAAGEDDPNVSYYVTDETASVDIINDFQIAENLTWSSTKIKSVIEAATPIVFDDTKTSTTMGWTSNKISTELGNKAEIDDTTPKETNVWSSKKTSDYVAEQTTGMATTQYVSENFEPKNSDLLTKTNADTLYEPKNNDLLTKTTADNTYEPKNSDLATKTWVNEQGFRTDAIPTDNITSSNFLAELKKYISVSGGQLIVNIV